MMQIDYEERIRGHYLSAWGDSGISSNFNKGPIHELPNKYSILEFEPRKTRNMWTYATCCMSQPYDDNPLELHMFSITRSNEVPEILTAVAHFYRSGNNLAIGHSVNFGKPWMNSSKCTYGLISLPYLDGPSLEICGLPSGKAVKFLWLIPITAGEVDFKKQHGLDALEQKLEDNQFDYADPSRSSVC